MSARILLTIALLAASLPGRCTCNFVSGIKLRTRCMVDAPPADCAAQAQALRKECQEHPAPPMALIGADSTETSLPMVGPDGKPINDAPGGTAGPTRMITPMAGDGQVNVQQKDLLQWLGEVDDHLAHLSAPDIAKGKADAAGASGAGGAGITNVTPKLQPTDPAVRQGEDAVIASGDRKGVTEIGQSYIDAGRPEDSRNFLDRALKKDPDNTDLRGMRSLANAQQGNFGAALSDAQEVLKKDPNNELALRVRGFALSKQRPLSSQIALLKPSFGGATDNGSQGDLAGAARTGRGGSPGTPAASFAANFAAGKSDPSVISGWSKFRIGDMNGAVDEASKALQKNPGDAQALGLRAAAYNRLGKPDLALADAEAALKAAPKDIVALLEKGYALYQMARYQEALASVETALQVDPLNAMGHLYRGMILEKLDRTKDAIAAYMKAAELDAGLKPLVDDALARLGVASGAAGRAGAAAARSWPKLALWSLALLAALGLLFKGVKRAIKPEWATPTTPPTPVR